MTELLAIVPARAGSVGVPGKNRALVGGVPLVEHTMAVARAARSVAGIVLTTDDTTILGHYRSDDDLLVVPRPSHLASHTASTVDVVEHALGAWKQAGRGDAEALLLLQPTTPLRRVADVDAAYALFRHADVESVVSAARVDGIRHPRVMYRRRPDGRGDLFIPDSTDQRTRHDYEPLFQRNGAIYLVSSDYFRRTHRMRSPTPVIYEMPWERSINVDSPADLLIVRALIESGLLATDCRDQ